MIVSVGYRVKSRKDIAFKNGLTAY
ncbi:MULTISPECIES: hypothetical protein [Segatella]|nr:hypothetical protein [Segatella copri]